MFFFYVIESSNNKMIYSKNHINNHIFEGTYDLFQFTTFIFKF